MKLETQYQGIYYIIMNIKSKCESVQLCAPLSVCLYASVGKTARRICTIIFGDVRGGSGECQLNTK